MRPIPTHVSGVGRPPGWLRLGLPLTVYPLVLLSIAAYRPLFGLLQRKVGLIEYMTVLLALVGVAMASRCSPRPGCGACCRRVG